MGSRRPDIGSRVLRLAGCFRGRRGFESRRQHRCHLGRRLRLRLRRGRIEGRAGTACACAGRRRRRARRRIEQRRHRRRRRARRRIEQRRHRRRRHQDLGWRRRDDDRPCGRHWGQRRERSDRGRRCRRSDRGGGRCNDRDGYSAVSILRSYLTPDIGLNLWRYGTRSAEVPVPDPTGYPSINRLGDTRCDDIAAPCPVPRPRHRCGCCRRRRGRDGSGGIRVRDGACGSDCRARRRSSRTGVGLRHGGRHGGIALILRYRQLILRSCRRSGVLLNHRAVRTGAVDPDRDIHVRRRGLRRRRAWNRGRGRGSRITA